MTENIGEVREFWDSHPCQSDLSDANDRRIYFDEIERKRYAHEPHIPVIAQFENYHGKDVLEIGCGISTDGLQFARGGACYTGYDLTPAAIATAKERFALYGAAGRFENVNCEHMPAPDESFDHIYSFGVIHHSPNTEAIVAEMYRVLRPGGTFCVMIYNRSSINYYVEIMFLRRLFRYMLLPSFMPKLLSRITGFPEWKLQGHRDVMLSQGALTKEQWISINTDGPDCPLAKVYNRREAGELFHAFQDVRMEAHFFDRTHWPVIGKRLPDGFCQWLGRRWGWHRVVYGTKPLTGAASIGRSSAGRS
ncbi:MAG: class I SAM-dependent methyltransferase [Candidatus Hydrogenedentes bacterium]|nr:class I SAM-dependent methyltransferase [Candidatus Hydrogenedentota bacterium]